MLVKMWSSLSISLDPRGCCPTVGQGPNIVMRMFSGPFYLQQSQHRGAFKNDFWPKHEATLVCSTMDGWLISIFSHQGLYNHKNDGEQCHFFCIMRTRTMYLPYLISIKQQPVSSTTSSPGHKLHEASCGSFPASTLWVRGPALSIRFNAVGIEGVGNLESPVALVM